MRRVNDGRRDTFGAKGFDCVIGARRYRPRAQRRRVDDIASPLDADGPLAALFAGARSARGGRAELVRRWLRAFGPATVTGVK